MQIKITRHCHKRILERARISERRERIKLVKRIVKEGYIIDKRGRNILIEYNEHYLIIRLTSKEPVVISYTSKIIPRGFSQRLTEKRKLKEMVGTSLN